MSLIDTPAMGKLARYLDVAALRGGVIANNIANLDTPGFRAKDVDFQEQLRRVMDGQPVEQRVSVREVPGLIERPDGNNVNLDREGLALGQTQLQFQTGASLLRNELHRLQMAIQEGESK